MKKTLSLLKPDLRTIFMNNQRKEKVSYLQISEFMGVKDLRSDVKAGAVQFQELDSLIQKEKEPKYILITTDNLEQGYMAVTYLAAAFNEKNQKESDNYSMDTFIGEPEEGIEEWEENEYHIPIISEDELLKSVGDEDDFYCLKGSNMLGRRNEFEYRPYWINCTHKSICITSNMVTNGFGCTSLFDDYNRNQLNEGLKYFQTNDKVYIIITDKTRNLDPEDEEWLRFEKDEARSKWNTIVLSYAADEISVQTQEKTIKQYYKLLFQSFFQKYGLIPKRGFSYEHLSNLIYFMMDADKCQLIEKVVNYAIKDWNTWEGHTIDMDDFAFMDRFCRIEKKKIKQQSAMDRMRDELVGMEEVKQQIYNIVNVMKFNQMRAKMKIKGSEYHNVHLMLGAPGTAKTTVAKFMGQIMMEEHLLPDNRFVCVNGAELKGMYVGHSAPKTKALFEENDIIVIDEAYALVGDCGEIDSFGKEALAQLVIELEEHSQDKLVIFAGYGGRKVTDRNNKMKEFLDANPGLKSRITSTIYFDSYNPGEMVNIFMKIADNKRYTVDENARRMIEEHFEKRITDENFGNGREARRLLETAVVFTAGRVFREKRKTYTRKEMQTITCEDIAAAIKQIENANDIQNVQYIKSKIGF